MKKLLTLAAIFALIFTACEQPTDEDNAPKLPSLTIRNESSYILTNVKFSNIVFAASGSDLPISSQSVKQLTANDVNKTGYITFTRKDIGIALRTEAISITDKDYTFTFTDNTSVEEQANSNNRNILAQISFLSRVTVERGGLNVAKNDTENIGETAVNYFKQTEFTLKNTGVGKLLLTGTEPVKISDTEGVFSIVQPTNSEIAPNGSLIFKINFMPKNIRTYMGTVTISSNNQDGVFSFTVIANGTAPKPIVGILYNNDDILQDGTIDAGEIIFTLSKNITVTIKNTGTLPLEIETGNITITGPEASSFTKTTNPGANISVDGQSLFIIECNPVKLGENNATLLIPTNDTLRNPVIIYLKVTAIQGHSVVELSQGNTVISDNSITPFDFGQVEVQTIKNLTFTIKNTGNIPLVLNGSPMVISSNANFTIFSQPLNSTVSPESTTTFVIQYEPTSENVDTGFITISNNSDSFIFIINVKGTGYVKKPQITMRQNDTAINQYGEFNFGIVAIGEPKDIIFTIGNSGDANLTFVTVDNNRINLGENGEEFFSVIQQPSSSTIVTPGSTTTFTVRFNPTTAGNSYMATVLIETNSRTNSEFSFIVKANSYEKKPQITMKQNNTNIVQNGEFNFGIVAIGEPKDIIFTIGNSGDANLTFVTVDNNRINLGENGEGYFSVIQQPSSNTVVAPESTTTFTVRFNPTTAENGYIATVLIETNSRTNNEFSFIVKANSYEKKPQITMKQNNTNIVQNGEYDFGTESLASGNSIDVTFTIGNSGEANLIIDTVNSNRINLADNTAGHFTVTSQPTSSTVVSPGNTTTFTIRFKPKSVGTNFYAVVQIKTNSQNNSDFSFRIKGSCVRYMIGDTGPGGGTIYYISGNQYKECSAILGTYNWNNAGTAARNHRGGNYTNWQLPDLIELIDLMSALGIGGTYWTSEQDPYYTSQAKSYSPGRYPYNIESEPKTLLYSVRAIRNFSL
jgi:hypothetical protein